MNIELQFLQKAIKERNYINFIYNNRQILKAKPLKLTEEKNYTLYTNKRCFEYEKMKKIQILKEKFTP